jgi:hypothetical protein
MVAVLCALLGLSLCATTGAGAATTAASRCVAPPGTSAIDQYCESVPDAAGGKGTSGGDAGGTAGGVSKTAAKSLKREGADGAAVLALAGGPAPESATKGKHKTSKSPASAPKRPTDTSAAPAAKPNDIFQTTAASLGDVSRVGTGFVWLLIGSIAGVGAWGWVGYRRRV